MPFIVEKVMGLSRICVHLMAVLLLSTEAGSAAVEFPSLSTSALIKEAPPML